MMLILCVILAIGGVLAKIDFKECGHDEIKEMTISDCDKSPCVFHKGKTVTITIVFTANQDSDKINLELLINLNGLELFLPMVGGTDVCKSSHGSPDSLPGTWQLEGNCPIKKGEIKTLKYMITPPEGIQNPQGGKLPVEITPKLTGDHGILACGSIKGDIMD